MHRRSGHRRRAPGIGWRLGSLLGLALASATLAAADAPPAATTVERLALPGGTLQVEIAGFGQARRVRELRAWIVECANATLTAYGRLPLREARVRVEPSTRRGRSPVPWGQTARGDDVAVLLYVREDATPAELRADWTAVHELSHLFHPFLGDEGRWLAEGLASYYQNVLRARAGLMDHEDAWRRLDAGFGRGRREASGRPLRELGHDHGGTMRIYWAGAAFWLESDLALRRHGSSLDTVLARYSQCCLRGTGEVAPRAFLAKLDKIAGGDDFLQRYTRYAAATAFPRLDDAYTALGLQARDDGLRLSDAPEAVALRRAIMDRPPPR
jgi:hypothetical protein